jgi:hypothetical protein
LPGGQGPFEAGILIPDLLELLPEQPIAVLVRAQLSWHLSADRHWGLLTIVSQPTDQVVLGGANVTFTIVVAGTGPITYQWQFNGTNLPNNIITTVAGGGASFSDNGSARNASLTSPQGVAVGTNNNLFISDNDDNVVRKVVTNALRSAVLIVSCQ